MRRDIAQVLMRVIRNRKLGLRRLAIIVATIAVTYSAFLTWQEICTLPNEIWVHDEFAMSIRQNKHSAAKLSWLVFDETSRQLAHHGTSSISWLDFTERCQAGDCTVTSFSITVQVKHRAACSWADNHFNHTAIEIDIIDLDTVSTEITLETIRAAWPDFHPLPNRFIQEIDWVRGHAIRKVADTESPYHPRLTSTTRYIWWLTGAWNVFIDRVSGTRLLDIDHPRDGQMWK